MLRQEFAVGLINGIALGALICLAALIWKGNIYLGLVVGSALTINTLFAVYLGGTVPLISKACKLTSSAVLISLSLLLNFK